MRDRLVSGHRPVWVSICVPIRVRRVRRNLRARLGSCGVRGAIRPGRHPARITVAPGIERLWALEGPVDATDCTGAAGPTNTANPAGTTSLADHAFRVTSVTRGDSGTSVGILMGRVLRGCHASQSHTAAASATAPTPTTALRNYGHRLRRNGTVRPCPARVGSAPRRATRG